MDTPVDAKSRGNGWLGHAQKRISARSIGPSIAVSVLGMVSSSKQVRHQTHQKQNYENEKENSGDLRSSESDNTETKDARY